MRAQQLPGDWRSRPGRKAKHLWKTGTTSGPLCARRIVWSRTKPTIAMRNDPTLCYDCLASGAAGHAL